MSFYTKPVTALEFCDLQSLLDEHAVENVRLEFKQEVMSDIPALKELSAFANTYGGYLIVGATEEAGVLNGLPGVPQRSNYNQTIVQLCTDRVSPPILVEVSQPIGVPGTSKVLYVLHVPESPITPHFINGRNGCFIRVDEHSRPITPKLAEEREIVHLLGRRRAVDERKQRLQERTSKRYSQFRSTQISVENSNTGSVFGGASFTIGFWPRYPAQPVLSQSDLKGSVKMCQLRVHGDFYPGEVGALITQYESVITFEPQYIPSYFEANIYGGLFYGTDVELSQRGHNHPSGIHVNHFLAKLLLYIKHAATWYEKTGLRVPLDIVFSVEGIRGAEWLHFPNGFPDTFPASPLDDEFTIPLSTNTSQLIADPDRIMKDLLLQVFFAANRAEWATEEETGKAVHLAYQYNKWNPGTSVKK